MIKALSHRRGYLIQLKVRSRRISQLGQYKPHRYILQIKLGLLRRLHLQLARYQVQFKPVLIEVWLLRLAARNRLTSQLHQFKPLRIKVRLRLLCHLQLAALYHLVIPQHQLKQLPIKVMLLRRCHLHQAPRFRGISRLLSREHQ